MNKIKSQEILSILNQVIEDPQCELHFSNNFELLCAVMLSAQTTDKRVNEITKVLFYKYPNAKALKNASYDEIYEIIKPLGLAKTKTQNLLSLASSLDEMYDGIVPSEMDKLIKLPGVGRKTANVVLALGFNIPSIPVDTHVYRIAKRLGYVKETDDVLATEEKLKKYIKKEDWIKSHHLMLLFGRYHCKAINPNCLDCKLKDYCKEKHRL